MRLEWDEEKRQRTLRERGLDWDNALTLEDFRQPYPETRFLTYGAIDGRMRVIA